MTTPQQERRLRVFLCHASGDKPAVRDLYYRLLADGFAPWLDEEDLLPGQDWQKEIPAAVRASDIVVVCLSQNFVKEGYRQKEVRVALSVEEEKADGTIFIIPARFEDVEVPSRLCQWTWVDLFQENGYKRLVRALNLRASDIVLTMGASISVITSAASAAQAVPTPTVPTATVRVEHEKSAANAVPETQPAQKIVFQQGPVAAVDKRPNRFGWNQNKFWYFAAVLIVLALTAVLIQVGPRKGESPREANSLSAKAMNEGDKYYKIEEYQQARERYELAAAAGNSEAMWDLGVIYEFGKGVTQDYQQARQWYEKAAAAGHATAMERIGVIYEKGHGVAKDYQQARQWYEKAFVAGDDDAEQRLQQLPK